MVPQTLLALLSAAALVSAAPAKRSDAPYGDKKGLAYSSANTNILSRSGSATWAYNWGATPNAPKFQQIPMCWGPGSGQCDTSGINSMLNSVSASNRYVLGYNEPDMCINGAGGSCASPAEAYNAWGDQMFGFNSNGAKLICPAITSDNSASGTGGGFPSGLQWLSAFLNHDGKNNPGQFRCYAQALHWYGCGQSIQDQASAFISYISSAHSQVDSLFHTTNFPLWITEFAPGDSSCSPTLSDADNSQFLAAVMPWLDQQSWVDRYSFFDAEKLISGNGLSQAGQTYVNTT